MATFLEANKTAIAQGVRVRRNGAKPSGVVVLHTAENLTDFVGPDTGAENVLAFIQRRLTYGCYHVLCDSDSTIQVAPWSWETWHDTATNNHSVGISAAIQCSQWDELGDRGEAIVKRMAQAAAEYAKWLKKERGITIPDRRITREQSRDLVPGFLGHGDSDPGRRSDPGTEFDWDLFFTEYRKAMGTEVKPTGAVENPKPPAVIGSGAPTRGNPKVLRIQGRMRAQGRYRGPLSGINDPMTKDAVRDYQKDQLFGGLYPDGYWGPVTERHFLWVRTLQLAMNKWKGADLLVDGDYGPATRARVKDLMTRNHGGAYRGYIDSIPGPVFCKMLGIPVHP